MRNRGTTQFTRQQSAFTLVELIVVVAILVLLLALLLPALESARDSAITTACLSTQRQLFLGQQNYAQDNNGDVLGITSGGSPGAPGGRNFYFAQMEPYASVSAGAWIDPGLPTGGAALYGSINYGVSPFFNAGAPLIPGKAARRLSEISFPSTTAWIMEALPYNPPDPLATWYAKVEGFFDFSNRQNSSWPMHGPTLSATLLNASGVSIGIRQFKSMSNVIRMDGSARTYLWSELVTRDYWSWLFGNAPTSPVNWNGACWGQRVARGYLFFGVAPTANTCQSGWLKED